MLRRSPRHLVHGRGDQDLDAQLGAIAHEVVLLGGHVTLFGEDDAAQGKVAHGFLEFVAVIEMIDDPVGDQVMDDAVVLGDEADDLEAAGAAQARDRGHGLVVDAIDQHAGAFLQLADLGLVGVIDIDHRQADGAQDQDREGPVEEQHRDDAVAEEVTGGEHHQRHHGNLADRRHEEEHRVLEGEMPDDDDVGLEKPEHQERTAHGGETPQQVKTPLRDDFHFQEKREYRHRDGYQQREEQIHSEDTSFPEELGAILI